jgi:hypothetical protein
MEDPTPERGAFARLARSWLPIAAAAGLVTIVALASRTTSVVSSGVAVDTGFVETAIEVVAYVAAIIGFVVFLPTVVVLRAQQRQRLAKRGPGEGTTPWWARAGGTAVTLGIIAAQVAIVVYIVELVRSGALRTNTGLDLPEVLDPSGLAGGRDGSSLMIALGIVAVLGVGTLAYAIKWRLRDAAERTDTNQDRRGRTEQAFEVGLDALRREPDPRRAIIAAYAAMERSLSNAGLGRHPWEAPIEYLRRVLAGALGDPKDVQTMTHLFEVAKFSLHEVHESMRSDAIEALERIRAATRAPVGRRAAIARR